MEIKTRFIVESKGIFTSPFTQKTFWETHSSVDIIENYWNENIRHL